MASSVDTPAPPADVASPTVRILKEALGPRGLGVTGCGGDRALPVTRETWVKAAAVLRDHAELDYRLFLDLCAVDYLDKDEYPERYQVVLHAYSVSKKHHVRLKVNVPE